MYARCPLLPELPELVEARAKAAAASGATVPDEAPSTIAVDVRVLSAVEESDCLGFAREYAARFSAEAKAGDPLYDLGLMVAVVHRSIIDTDSQAEHPESFFASPDEVLELDRDRIAYLYESQQTWQDECAPQAAQFTEDQFFGWVVGLAASESPQIPFAYTRPGLRWSLVRTMANQLLTSQQGRSPLGWLSGTSSKSGPSESNAP
jgi:hypothetical protein